MKTRVLALVLVSTAMFLNFAPSSQAGQFTCPVTKLVPITFEPAGKFADRSANLLGTEKLFTIFPGNWHLVQQTDRGYRVPKIIWNTNVVDLHEEIHHSSLTITARRLDADSGPLVDWDANTAWTDRANPGLGGKKTPVAEVDKRDFAITSEFTLPALGCWEVTGHFHGESLKVVIDATRSTRL